MPHSWDVSPKEAIAIQERMSQHVMRTDQLDEVHWVAGIDVGFEAQGTITHAAVAVLSFPAMELEEQATARRPTTFPYVPGLLSFREVPVILDALEKLKRQPDLLLCDGQGLAHPRRFGLACHLGLLVDLPSIGVGKSRLVGQSEPVGAKRAERQPLIDGDEVIGFVLRTRTDVKPLFISIGHRVSLETAVEYVLQCGGKYRLPEPIRQAHRLASSA